jgi:hypothetical protein
MRGLNRGNQFLRERGNSSLQVAHRLYHLRPSEKGTTQEGLKTRPHHHARFLGRLANGRDV